MISHGGDKSKRAIKVIDGLEKEFPEEFKEALNTKGHKAGEEKCLGPSEVVAMKNDGNIKMMQLIMFNRYMKEGTGRKVCETKKLPETKWINLSLLTFEILKRKSMEF